MRKPRKIHRTLRIDPAMDFEIMGLANIDGINFTDEVKLILSTGLEVRRMATAAVVNQKYLNQVANDAAVEDLR